MANNNTKNVDNTVQEVDAAISKSEQFVENNKNTIMYALIGIIVLVAAVWGWNKISASNNEKAQDEIWASQLLFEQGQYEQALEGFEALISEYGSTKSGNLAKAYAGLCNKELGNYAEAINQLKDFSGNDDVLAPAILAAQGDCYVNQENPDNKKAAELFEKAAKAADNAQFSPLYLKKAGLAYEAAGDNAAALKAYQTIKDNWAETMSAQTIDKYIERVK